MRLIRPRLQLRLIFSFLGAGALGLLLQYMLISAALASISAKLPQDGPLLMASAGSTLATILLLSFCGLLPIVFVIGLWATHRFAGPVFRFESYLRQVISGAKPADCSLRKGDELQELCQLINDATRPLRVPGPAPLPSAPAAGETIDPPLPRNSASAAR